MIDEFLDMDMLEQRQMIAKLQSIYDTEKRVEYATIWKD